MRPSPSCQRLPLTALAWFAPLALAACSPEAGARTASWTGTIDTLASGRVVVVNPSEPLWKEGERWTVTEDLRIGTLDEPGPYEFAEIIALDVDAFGRIWALEAQSKEIRVFDAQGRHVRTVGGAGGGPGEFNGPAHAEFGPDGHLWVVDPQNNRISVIDTAGTFVASHRIEGGFFMSPWPGGFDLHGNYYLPVPRSDPDRGFGLSLVRHDLDLTPMDTLTRLTDPVERDAFELRSDDGGMRMRASIPYAPGFLTHRSPQGTMWGLFTGEYRLIELSRAGDTLRTIVNQYEPIPVTGEDRDAAREGLSWFTEQGGKIDLAKMPDTKPAARSFFVDGEGRIWLARLTDRPEGQDFDLLDAQGRFLGRVTLPAALRRVRRVKGDYLYGVTENELEVPFIVRARIERAEHTGDDTGG